MNSLLRDLKQYTNDLEIALVNKEQSKAPISGMISHHGIMVPMTEELRATIDSQHHERISRIIKNLEKTVDHMKSDMELK